MKRILTLLSCILTLGQGFTQTIPDMIEKALPAVVSVAVYQSEESRQLLGFKGQVEETAYEKALDLTGSEGMGSGFVIERSGKKYVITNAHVIENASLRNGSLYIYSISRKKYEVKVLGGDIIYDVAVLEFVTPPGNEFTSLAFEPGEPRIGEQVFAIGNPLGEFPYSVVDGIISAKNRTTTGLPGFQGKFGYLQTTATLIWGNSGGPLINVKGNVVGINSQLYAEQVGNTQVITPQINFALEAKTANRIITDIIKTNGKVNRAFLGVEIIMRYQRDPYSYNSSDPFEVIDSVPIVNSIITGSPAESGLKDKTGYQVVSINGISVTCIEEVMKELESIRPGQTVTFTLRHGSLKENVSVTAGTLNSRESRLIGIHIFDTQKQYRINEADGKVSLTMEGEPSVSSGNSDLRNYLNDYMKNNQKPMIEQGTWQIVSAGLYSEEEKNMWVVESLADLGVVCRIMGPLGYMDFLMQREGYYSTDLQEGYIIFSGDQNIKQETVWY